MSTHHVRARAFEAQEALAHLLSDEVMLERINAAGNLMADALQSGGRIYSCGNGGVSAMRCTFAEEMTGRYRNNRPAYAATAIADASHMACVANDFGYEYVSPATLKASRVREMSRLAFPLRARAKTCSVRLRRPEPRG